MSVEFAFEGDSVRRSKKQRSKNQIIYNYINSDLYDSLRARVDTISVRLSRNDVVFFLLYFLFITIGYNAQTGVFVCVCVCTGDINTFRHSANNIVWLLEDATVIGNRKKRKMLYLCILYNKFMDSFKIPNKTGKYFIQYHLYYLGE